MAYRQVSKTNAKTAEDAMAFIAVDTGGSVVPTGKVREIWWGWEVEVFSCDGLNDVPLAAGRAYFQVKSWSDEQGQGVVTDRAGIEYEVRRKNLFEECHGSLVVGQRVSGRVNNLSVTEVFPEPGPSKRHDPGALTDAAIDEQIQMFGN